MFRRARARVRHSTAPRQGSPVEEILIEKMTLAHPLIPATYRSPYVVRARSRFRDYLPSTYLSRVTAPVEHGHPAIAFSTGRVFNILTRHSSGTSR